MPTDYLPQIYHPLVDLTSLAVIPKTVRPIPDMLPNESRRLWEHVTSASDGSFALTLY
jgi:hypothetical protein